MLSLAIILSCHLALSFAKYQTLDGALNETYDYIVAGGGAAGSIIANRLTEVSSNKVLVIEAGPSNLDVLDTEVPLFCTTVVPNTPYDWNYTVVPQIGYDNSTFAYPRGRILGGSSSVNYMFYTRGSSDDYDGYANSTGDDGFSWDNMQTYFKKNERWTPPHDNHNTSEQFDPTVHGYDGFTSVSLAGYPSPISDRIISAAHELGGEFAFRLDANAGNPLGVGYVQYNINDTQRSSSATSYLADKYLQRDNLDVLLNTYVSRVLETNASAALECAPDVRTVEFLSAESSSLHTITAAKEVILSAGTIGTPTILLHSGIGNSTELADLSISPLVALPAVGKNLSDHSLTNNVFTVTGNDTIENYFRDPTLQAQLLEDWINQDNTSGGILVDSPFTHWAFIRLNASNPILQNVTDTTPGPLSPHYEIIFANGIPRPSAPTTGHYLTLSATVSHPVSRGSVTINSTNPFDPPLIDPGYMRESFDLSVMREAMKGARKFVNASSWAGYVSEPFNAPGWNATDDELDQYIISGGSTGLWHPVGTARMTPKGDFEGVVDPDFKVKNVTGLRVVDASVLPRLPSAHTLAVTSVFAERAADIIKQGN